MVGAAWHDGCMRFHAGRALRGIYDERGGPGGDRTVRFVVEPSGRFALWCQVSGDEARSNGATVWAIDDGAATFVGVVPPADRGAFGVMPVTISEMLHPESAYIEAAFADPETATRSSTWVRCGSPAASRPSSTTAASTSSTSTCAPTASSGG